MQRKKRFKQRRQVKLMGIITKGRINTITAQKTEQQDVTDIQNKILFAFSFIPILFFYFRFLKMISPRIVELPPWYGQ